MPVGRQGKFISSFSEKQGSRAKRGVLIVLEGTDGSGKATQLKLLVKWLKKQGYKVKTTDFPQYYSSFFGKLVGRFLKGEFGGIHEVSPYLACLPYAGDRFEAKERIEKWLSSGKIVVFNRYFGSQAHQLAKLPAKEQLKFLHFLVKMEYEVFGIPREDIVIFLYMPVEIGQRLVDKKGKRSYAGGKKRDIHEASLLHQRKASEVYLRLVKRYPYWVKIDCCDRKGNLRTPEEIHKRILGILERRKVL